MDVSREIRKTVDTGKVFFGTEKTLKALRNGDAKLVIYTKNCPEKVKSDVRYYSELSKTPTYAFEGSALELGTLCGKPFIVSVMTIISQGESNILALEGT
ncbi:MAG: 50S ribosomal protein L30e [Candidatus Methanofastidiosia archaeon]